MQVVELKRGAQKQKLEVKNRLEIKICIDRELQRGFIFVTVYAGCPTIALWLF